MKKRILSLALAFCLVAALLPPMRASAAKAPWTGATNTISTGLGGSFSVVKEDGSMYAYLSIYTYLQNEGNADFSMQDAVSAYAPKFMHYQSDAPDMVFGVIKSDGSLWLSNVSNGPGTPIKVLDDVVSASFRGSYGEDRAVKADNSLWRIDYDAWDDTLDFEKIDDNVIAVSGDYYIKTDHSLWTITSMWDFTNQKWATEIKKSYGWRFHRQRR